MELSTQPFSEQFVECPVCGATHAVLPGVARKIERGLRTGRCPRCVGAGAWVERSPLSNQEREVLSRWWLKRFSDSELAKFAQALGVEHASAEAIAIARVRNGRL